MGEDGGVQRDTEAPCPEPPLSTPPGAHHKRQCCLLNVASDIGPASHTGAFSAPLQGSFKLAPCTKHLDFEHLFETTAFRVGTNHSAEGQQGTAPGHGSSD